jgi:glycosyltransferase involved in cell wall biosynthesis
MSKPTFLISCPIDTYSGYGARSRDIVKAIIELDKYEVKIMPQRWGQTPKGFIKNNPEWEFLSKHILTVQPPNQPEIWMQITVPNEFQPVGKYNIGCTAGIESTIAPGDWIEGCNRMNLILGSSKHTIDVLKNSKWEKRDKQTNQSQGMLEWNGENEIIFEGANTDVYKPIKSNFDLSNIKEDFAYLFVGHWMEGQMGEDRKNVGLLIKAFYETFKNKSKKPALILKTSTVGSSYLDRDRILKRVKQIKDSCKSNNLPNVYLLHGEFTDIEINEIYNHSKVKAMVNLTKGEGFGRPLLEFSLVNKPIITTNWSGHIDYLNSEFTTLLQGTMTKIHPSAANNMLLAEAEWFSVDTGHVGHYLKDVFENYKKYAENAKRQGFQSRTKFSYEKMKEKLDALFTLKIPEFPKQVQLKLPQLKKIELPKLKKIELPKLNKIELPKLKTVE